MTHMDMSGLRLTKGFIINKSMNLIETLYLQPRKDFYSFYSESVQFIERFYHVIHYLSVLSLGPDKLRFRTIRKKEYPGCLFMYM